MPSTMVTLIYNINFSRVTHVVHASMIYKVFFLPRSRYKKQDRTKRRTKLSNKKRKLSSFTFLTYLEQSKSKFYQEMIQIPFKIC